jgi:hypothetical protein
MLKSPLPILLLLLLDVPAGRIDRELWLMNQGFSPVDVLPWLSILICHVGVEE